VAAEFARSQPGRLQRLECSTGESLQLKIADIDELKTRVIDEWAQFDQSIVDAAISQWRRRLSAYVRVRGAHFINLLKAKGPYGHLHRSTIQYELYIK